MLNFLVDLFFLIRPQQRPLNLQRKFFKTEIIYSFHLFISLSFVLYKFWNISLILT